MYNAMTKVSITQIEIMDMVITAICEEEGESLTSGRGFFNFVLPNALSSVFHPTVLLRNAVVYA